MTARLRVAIAGAGWVSSHHLQGWRRLPDVDIVGICDSDRARAAAAAQRFGIPAVFTDTTTMLEELHPHALDIAAPVAAHGPLCLLAATHGVDILCQKPLCTTYEEAERVIAAVTPHVRLMVHENWRFRPHYRRIKQWLDAGLLGDPISCAITVRASGLLPDDSGRVAQLERQPFFAHLERLLIGETLVHHLDLLRWLLGPMRLVAARTARVSTTVVGEDCGVLMLEAADSWAVIDANLACPGAPSKTSDVFELVGTAGVATFANGVAELRGAHVDHVRFEPDAAYLDSYAGAIAHFVDCLISGGEFEVTGSEHLRTLELVEAAYASAARQ